MLENMYIAKRVMNLFGSRIQYVSGGSDQAAFVYMLGIPALWPRYSFDVSMDVLYGLQM